MDLQTKLKRLFVQLRKQHIVAAEVPTREILEFTGAVYSEALDQGYKVSHIDEVPNILNINIKPTTNKWGEVNAIPESREHRKVIYYIRLFPQSQSIMIESEPPVTVAWGS